MLIFLNLFIGLKIHVFYFLKVFTSEKIISYSSGLVNFKNRFFSYRNTSGTRKTSKVKGVEVISPFKGAPIYIYFFFFFIFFFYFFFCKIKNIK